MTPWVSPTTLGVWEEQKPQRFLLVVELVHSLLPYAPKLHLLSGGMLPAHMALWYTVHHS